MKLGSIIDNVFVTNLGTRKLEEEKLSYVMETQIDIALLNQFFVILLSFLLCNRCVFSINLCFMITWFLGCSCDTLPRTVSCFNFNNVTRMEEGRV
jgi:hypothetical protein